MPAGEITVMVVTVACVVATHNLAIGVVVGPSPPWSSSPGASPTSPNVTASSTDPDGTTRRLPRHRRAVLRLQQRPRPQFDYAGDPDQVVIDLSAAHIWDASSVAALDAIATKYAAAARPSRSSASTPSAELHEQLSGALPSH